jgi:hypothetical protein
MLEFNSRNISNAIIYIGVIWMIFCAPVLYILLENENILWSGFMGFVPVIVLAPFAKKNKNKMS